MTSSIRGERLVVGALEHLAQDGVGRIAAVGQNDARGGFEPLLLIGRERGNRIGVFEQRRGQRPRIEDRLAGAVGAARHHRMGGVAEQRHPAEAPARQRVLIDHRKFQHVSAARMNAGTSSQSKCQSAKAPMKSSIAPGRFQSRLR